MSKSNANNSDSTKTADSPLSKIEGENLMLNAKCEIAETRIKWLMFLLTLCGVIVPILVSVAQYTSTNKQAADLNEAIVKMKAEQQQAADKQSANVEKAIVEMKNDFKELAGRQLQKPKLVCKNEKDEQLRNSVFEITDRHDTGYIIIYNQGTGIAGELDVYLYFKNVDTYLASSISSFASDWKEELCDDKNFSIKYKVANRDHLSSSDQFSLRIRFPGVVGYESEAALKIFYEGQEQPELIPFTIRLGKKNSAAVKISNP